jgi:hypothetical protein
MLRMSRHMRPSAGTLNRRGQREKRQAGGEWRVPESMQNAAAAAAM